MNLRDLQREAHAIAKDHGWWYTERTFGDCIALVHSELSEALEAYREYGLKDWRSHTYDDGFVDEHPHGEKPEGVASELADVVIRVADMAEHYGVDLAARIASLSLLSRPGEGLDTFGDWITACHAWLSDTFRSYGNETRGIDLPGTWLIGMGMLIKCIQAMAAHYGIDLDAAIAAKMEYNRTRSYRHGGKAL